VLALAVLGAGAACSSARAPTPALTDAREAYVGAAQGPAAQLAPAALAGAKASLDDADRAHRKHDPREVDVAELAESRAALADARAQAVLAFETRNEAAARLAQITQERSAQAAKEGEDFRDGAHGRTNRQPTPSLRRVADHEEPSPGGGSALLVTRGLEFAPGSADLRLAARNKLDDLAAAIRAEPRVSTVTVDGFSDASGRDAANRSLSRERAQAVVNYLRSKGVPRDRLTARGRGAERPIGDNGTLPGRAMNRRVEIRIVQRPG
jgi:outer membrane protein OmpA-like peptidoglycan-associated protein